MARGKTTRGRRVRCYTAKRSGSSARAGVAITPWDQVGRPPHPNLRNLGTPRKPEPPQLTRFKERLALGRVRLPRVPPTVSEAPASVRVERALGSLQVFETIDTDATAYDAVIAAGPEHLLVATNFKVAVLDKANGATLLKKGLHDWFATVLPAEVDFVFDPRVLYDQHDARWVLVASGARHADFTSGLQLLSVSQTSDPGGQWWVWAFPEPGGARALWPDHPCLGVDAHALYLSANLFANHNVDAASKARLRVIPKTAPYAGGVVTHTDFDDLRNPVDAAHPNSTPAHTTFPCHTWGAPGVEYLVSTRMDSQSGNETTVLLWKVTDPAGNPQLTHQSVTVPTYVPGLPRVPQQNGPVINAGDAKVRNAVFNGGSIWFSFATSDRPDPSVSSEIVGVARWYQLDPVTAGLVQKGNFGVANVHHSYPAIVPDMHGNAALVVGRSSANELVSVQVTARRASDPPSQLPTSRPLHIGQAVHDHNDTSGNNRWGDYHAAALDPADGVTIWVYGGYPVSKEVWGTAVGALRV
jgi:hypothetical protein